MVCAWCENVEKRAERGRTWTQRMLLRVSAVIELSGTCEGGGARCTRVRRGRGEERERRGRGEERARDVRGKRGRARGEGSRQQEQAEERKGGEEERRRGGEEEKRRGGEAERRGEKEEERTGGWGHLDDLAAALRVEVAADDNLQRTRQRRHKRRLPSPRRAVQEEGQRRGRGRFEPSALRGA
eukprot:1071838-Rhodomonas_salina.4